MTNLVTFPRRFSFKMSFNCTSRDEHIRAKAAASDMGTINSSDRIAVTLYCLGTWFVYGMYV
jgi:hypothetical protein